MPGVPQRSDDDDTPATGQGRGDHGNAPEPEHDLTTAITLGALRELADPAGVVADAKSWSDWVGVVGDVSGPEMNAYFRDHGLDVDFFNDVSDEPTERLAAIDDDHHFHSERQVLVCLPAERAWADQAGWEFQSIWTVAEEAGWTLAED